MIRIVEKPAELVHGEDKKITEYIGNVSTKTGGISIARIRHPEGWSEPGQTPEFDEYSIVLNGTLRLETKDETFDLKPSQTAIIEKNTWVRYSTPHEGGAEYIAVCLPAFSLDIANRDQ